jgi:hypothetical protein
LSLAKGLDTLSGVGGTSIGSVLAAQIAVRQKIDINLFAELMSRVFKHKRIGAPIFWTHHDDKNLNKALTSLFSGKMIGDAKIPFFCTSVAMGERNLRVFSSENDNDVTWPLWEVVRASCAAPTYFPSWRGLSDGGLFCNNPSMVGCAWAKKVLGCPFEEMDVFSLGCGTSMVSTRQPRDDIFSLAPWLIRASLDGASDRMHDYFVRSLPLRSYTRMNFTNESNWEMNDLNDMKEVGEMWARRAMQVSSELNSFLAK